MFEIDAVMKKSKTVEIRIIPFNVKRMVTVDPVKYVGR